MATALTYKKVSLGMMSSFYMVTSIGIRMAVGIVVFAMLARGLGPLDFGLIASVFSYASFASLLTDFGLSTKMLRDIAAAPSEGGERLLQSIAIKGVLTATVAGGGLVALLLLPLGTEAQAASAMLALGVLIASIGDLVLVSFRAVGLFRKETLLLLWTSLLYALVVITTALLGGGLIAVAFGFLTCRCIYALAALISASRLFQTKLRLVQQDNLWRSIQGTWRWALLSNLSYLNGQLDSFLIAPFLGLHAAGVYQAGAKFAQSAGTFASVVTNTQVPKLVGGTLNRSRTLRIELISWGQMLFLGFLFAFVLWFAGPFITRLVVGKDYMEVDSLWLGFACLILCRFVSSAAFVPLIAQNRVGATLLGEFSTTWIVLPLLVLYLPQGGLPVVPWIMSVGALGTAATLLIARILTRA